MKNITLWSLIAIACSTIILSACGGGDKTSIEVDDKLLGDGKEINVETPAGDTHIDLPKTETE